MKGKVQQLVLLTLGVAGAESFLVPEKVRIGPFSIHRSIYPYHGRLLVAPDGVWVVTHRQSGRRAGVGSWRLKDAKEYATRLAAVKGVNWEREEPLEGISKTALEKLKKLYREYA